MSYWVENKRRLFASLLSHSLLSFLPFLRPQFFGDWLIDNCVNESLIDTLSIAENQKPKKEKTYTDLMFFFFSFLYFLASALCLFWVMGVVPYTKHHDSISVVWVWVGTLQSARVSLRFLVRYRNSKPPMRSGFFPPKLELYFFDFSGTWTSCSDGTWRALIVLKNYCRPKRLHWVGRHKMKSNFQ